MTSRIRTWSSSPAGNNQTPPNGAPEGGTYVNQVSDIFRQIMAEVRAWYEVPGWIDFGHTPTYSSSTAFTVTGNQTSNYEVGRRVRAINSTLTTIYGTITASVFTVTTLVTVSWDSGTLDNTVAEVAVGSSSISGASIASACVKGLGALATKTMIMTADITDAAVTAVKVADGVLTTAKMATSALASAAAEFVSGATTKLATAGGVFAYIDNLGFKNTLYQEKTAQIVLAATPFDTTIPQITEGTEIFSATFTPKRTDSKVRIRIRANGNGAAASTVICALHVNGAADAVASTVSSTADSTGRWWTLDFEFEHLPVSTSAITYVVRMGYSGAVATINPTGWTLGGTQRGATLIIGEA